MNKFFKPLNMLVMMSFLTACSALTVQAQPAEPASPKAVTYQAVLGKSANDADVIKFIASNNCSALGPLQVCREAGLAVWINSAQVVKTIYLYSGGEAGFKRYRGKLPFNLTFYDPMWLVEDKLKKLETNDTLSQAGLPDEGNTPDHIHYWAVYKRFGIVVIYDEPFADEDAYIYAILVNG
jgi:hypothetical protein